MNECLYYMTSDKPQMKLQRMHTKCQVQEVTKNWGVVSPSPLGVGSGEARCALSPDFFLLYFGVKTFVFSGAFCVVF